MVVIEQTGNFKIFFHKEGVSTKPSDYFIANIEEEIAKLKDKLLMLNKLKNYMDTDEKVVNFNNKPYIYVGECFYSEVKQSIQYDGKWYVDLELLDEVTIDEELCLTYKITE